MSGVFVESWLQSKMYGELNLHESNMMFEIGQFDEAKKNTLPFVP
jgi:hypothetical protein